jgi:TPR repeat protein
LACELDPYTLGATPSSYGDVATYGQRDEYVPRTKDQLLAAALRPDRLVVLAGPSKVGKTRTAFEVVRTHDEWSTALLAAPTPQCLNQLVGHPPLRSTDPLVIWLDELHRFLSPAGSLSQAIVSRLLNRPGPTVLVATMRAGQRDLLRSVEGELTRDARVVLDSATWIELASTRLDPGEQARAATVYPEADSRQEGLAEALARAPELLRRYRGAATANPALHMLVQICVDWARCGLARPIPEADLLLLVRTALKEDRADLIMPDNEVHQALRQTREAVAGKGQVAMLRTHRSADLSCAYEASDYLVAADDGQNGEQVRPVPAAIWRRILDRVADQDALGVAVAAYLRGNIPVAVAASSRAAAADDTGAQYNLGTLLATRLNPPDLPGARTWWTKAAQAGHTDAQYNLGILLAYELEPPELAEARTWWTRAAEAGDVAAQYDLGRLLVDRLDPPDLAAARTWWTKAAQSGHSGAQYGLGVLLACQQDPPDLAAARTWWTKAAQSGHVRAQYNLGRLLALGLSTADLAAAWTWWTKAAHADHTRAEGNLKQIEDRPVLVQVPHLTDPGP